MSLSKKQMIFSLNIADLIFQANEWGIGLTFGDAYRTKKTQRCYVDNNLSKTMKSLHLKRLAVDFNFFINGDLTYKKLDIQRLGDYWEGLHPKNKWGGNFKSFIDTPHFQMSE